MGREKSRPFLKMPAVDRTRLQTQIRLVTQYFASADEFVKRLSELFDYYSDRSFTQPGQNQLSTSRETYNVTPLVMRQFEFAFSQLSRENPLSSLDVIDRLWKERKQEPRRLAAYLLGKMPTDYSQQVIERLQNWSKPTEDRELIQYLHNAGSEGLRHEAIELWLSQIALWLESKQAHDQIFGLQSLLPLIEDEDFHNLPRVFNLIQPLVRQPGSRVLFTLQNVLEALARRSPVETVFNLKLILQSNYAPDVPRLFRRLSAAFPEEQAQSLRLAIKDAQN
ncbi:MAG: DNA alkylation repair protein [Anaerolineaceae bacterium]|nr:DNA alkylation repair protein [Anaerolineaceae bacterium]